MSLLTKQQRRLVTNYLLELSLYESLMRFVVWLELETVGCCCVLIRCFRWSQLASPSHYISIVHLSNKLLIMEVISLESLFKLIPVFFFFYSRKV